MSKEMLLKAATNHIKHKDKALGNAKPRQRACVVELLSQGYSAGMRELGDQFGRGEYLSLN